MLGLTPEFADLSLNSQQEANEDEFHARLQSLLLDRSELESNVYYCLWLLCKLGGRNVSQGRLCDPVAMQQSIRGFNWTITDGGNLVDQLSFYQKPQETMQVDVKTE